MQRVSNKKHDQVHYIDRVVEKVIHTQSEPEVHTVEVEKLVEVPVTVDLSIIKTHIDNHEDKLQSMVLLHKTVIGELEMQRRALVGLKQQRDVDRSRRLILIRRMRKEQKAHKKTELQLKLAVGASLILSIIALILH